MSDDPDGEVGRGRPPVASRFRPGQSGNPKGRPRGKRTKHPYEVVLGQMVTVRENGEKFRMRADEAFLLHIANNGLTGGGVMARAVLRTIRDKAGTERNSGPPLRIVMRVYAEPGDTKYATQALQISKLLDGQRESARLVLETWAVEAALAGLGDRQLTVDEQQTVMAATRLPHKVRWPTWWSIPPT